MHAPSSLQAPLPANRIFISRPVYVHVDDPQQSWGVPLANDTICPACYNASSQMRFWGFATAALDVAAVQRLVTCM